MSLKLQVARGYLSEVLLATLLTVLLYTWFDSLQVSRFIAQEKASLFALSLAFVGLSGGLWVGSFFAFCRDSFSKFLRVHNALGLITVGMAFPTAINVLWAFSLLLVSDSFNLYISGFACAVGVYALVNMITLFNNIRKMVILFCHFDSDEGDSAASNTSGNSNQRSDNSAV